MRLSTTLETTVTVSDAGQDNLLYDQPRAVSDENGWSGLVVLCSTEHLSAITDDADGTDANVAFYVGYGSTLRAACDIRVATQEAAAEIDGSNDCCCY